MIERGITGIAPIFKNVPGALSVHRDRLGFDITFQGPHSDDIFFGIVQRGAARSTCFRDCQVSVQRWPIRLPRHFGTVERVITADEITLMQVPGLGPTKARRIREITTDRHIRQVGFDVIPATRPRRTRKPRRSRLARRTHGSE
jgi:hypothetical protein